MSRTSKASKVADNIKLKAQNRAAIKARFPKAKLLAQFKKLAEATGSEQEAADAKRHTAYMICEVASVYRADAGKDTDDLSTILDSWREHWSGLIPELHAKGNPFVVEGEPNKAGDTKPVMSGYGRNVASAARGVIEYDVPVVDGEGAARNYTDITAQIVQARRDTLPEEQRTMNTAKDELQASIKALRKHCGKNMEAVAMATTVIRFAADILKSHGSDGLMYVGLYLDEFSIEDYATELEPDTEDGANDAEMPGTDDETDEVEVAAA